MRLFKSGKAAEQFVTTSKVNQTVTDFISRETFHIPFPCMVTGDRHTPFINLEWHKKLMKVAKERNIKTLIESGDYFNQDCFSSWFPEYGPPIIYSWAAEVDSATEVMADTLSWFDNIYIIMGNHDKRVWRKVGMGQDLSLLFRMITSDPRVHVSNLPYCYAGNDTFMIVHPKTYAQTTSATAKKLAEKHRKHVIAAHGHFLGLDYTRCGKYLCIDSGGLFNYDTILYIHASITTHDHWQNGFVVINEEGKVHLYGTGLEE